VPSKSLLRSAQGKKASITIVNPIILAFVALLAAQTIPVWAQPPLSIREAVTLALEKYPAIGVSQAQVTAASAGIHAARTSYLPRVDALAQVNRATRNNVAGLLFAQGLPTVSGQALEQNSMANVWGTAVGFLVAWEPFDFGLRHANVAVAEAAKTRASAAVARTRLEVETLAADSVLTLLAAEQTVRAAEAGVERSEVFFKVVESLVQSKIRPGVELSRARAENSAAKTQLIQSRQAVAVAQALLARLLGLEPAEVRVAAGHLLDLPPAPGQPANSLVQNPSALEQDTAIEEAKARLKALERAYYPRFSVLGSTYARGTGAHANGSTMGGLNGLGPNIANWAVGFAATLPIMEFASLRARKEAEAARIQAETGRYRQIVVDLKGRLDAALAAADSARQVADNTPVQVEAAAATHRQSVARYRAGLGTVIEVSDAQRLLTQAEIDDSLAKLSVWRALLAVASTQGDLQTFLQRASQ
jgi:outer membrane protein